MLEVLNIYISDLSIPECGTIQNLLDKNFSLEANVTIYDDRTTSLRPLLLLLLF